MNVVSNDCGLKWMWSQMNVVSNKCGLKWTWSQMSWSQMNVDSNEWSQMNVDSNEWSQRNVVSNELVSIVMEPLGFSGRYTVYHTQNSNHLDQNIGIICHKRWMLVNDNTAEYNVSQEKKQLSRNYPRWRCRHDKSACRLLKTSQESRDWSRANFLTAVAFSKRVWD